MFKDANDIWLGTEKLSEVLHKLPLKIGHGPMAYIALRAHEHLLQYMYRSYPDNTVVINTLQLHEGYKDGWITPQELRASKNLMMKSLDQSNPLDCICTLLLSPFPSTYDQFLKSILLYLESNAKHDGIKGLLGAMRTSVSKSLQEIQLRLDLASSTSENRSLQTDSNYKC
jgi:hypothetical protein